MSLLVPPCQVQLPNPDSRLLMLPTTQLRIVHGR
nr:MAG TPA: hypothetical protein [Caudoviricetes sp.]